MVKDSVKFLVDTMVKRTRLVAENDEEEGGAASDQDVIRVTGGQIPREIDPKSGICLC